MKHFYLFAHVHITRGISRILLIDTRTQQLYFLGKEYDALMISLQEQRYVAVTPELAAAELVSILDDLAGAGMGFFGAPGVPVAPAVATGRLPARPVITNLVIELSAYNLPMLRDKATQLFADIANPDLFVFMLVTGDVAPDQLSSFLLLLSGYISSPVTLLVPYHIFRKDMPEALGQHLALNIICHTTEDQEVPDACAGHTKVVYLPGKMDMMHCGTIAEHFFATGKQALAEAQVYNSCLGGKISINAGGAIMNCLAMEESYGNIQNTRLVTAMALPGFFQYWYLTKDKITTCRDCEFRDICTDCRAYTEDPSDKLSRPLKCGYDPVTNEWENWSTHPMKQQAMSYYRDRYAGLQHGRQ